MSGVLEVLRVWSGVGRRRRLLGRRVGQLAPYPGWKLIADRLAAKKKEGGRP
jgi:hypothetical protein